MTGWPAMLHWREYSDSVAQLQLCRLGWTHAAMSAWQLCRKGSRGTVHSGATRVSSCRQAWAWAQGHAGSRGPRHAPPPHVPARLGCRWPGSPPNPMRWPHPDGRPPTSDPRSPPQLPHTRAVPAGAGGWGWPRRRRSRWGRPASGWWRTCGAPAVGLVGAGQGQRHACWATAGLPALTYRPRSETRWSSRHRSSRTARTSCPCTSSPPGPVGAGTAVGWVGRGTGPRPLTPTPGAQSPLTGQGLVTRLPKSARPAPPFSLACPRAPRKPRLPSPAPDPC